VVRAVFTIKLEEIMLSKKEFKNELMQLLDILPDEKIYIIIDFARYLTQKCKKENESAVDNESLIIQQQALAHIWDNPKEDIYEL
jgi:hypothetical protein